MPFADKYDEKGENDGIPNRPKLILKPDQGVRPRMTVGLLQSAIALKMPGAGSLSAMAIFSPTSQRCGAKTETHPAMSKAAEINSK